MKILFFLIIFTLFFLGETIKENKLTYEEKEVVENLKNRHEIGLSKQVLETIGFTQEEYKKAKEKGIKKHAAFKNYYKENGEMIKMRYHVEHSREITNIDFEEHIEDFQFLENSLDNSSTLFMRIRNSEESLKITKKWKKEDAIVCGNCDYPFYEPLEFPEELEVDMKDGRKIMKIKLKKINLEEVAHTIEATITGHPPYDPNLTNHLDSGLGWGPSYTKDWNVGFNYEDGKAKDIIPIYGNLITCSNCYLNLGIEFKFQISISWLSFKKFEFSIRPTFEASIEASLENVNWNEEKEVDIISEKELFLMIFGMGPLSVNLALYGGLSTKFTAEVSLQNMLKYGKKFIARGFLGVFYEHSQGWYNQSSLDHQFFTTSFFSNNPDLEISLGVALIPKIGISLYSAAKVEFSVEPTITTDFSVDNEHCQRGVVGYNTFFETTGKIGFPKIKLPVFSGLINEFLPQFWDFTIFGKTELTCSVCSGCLGDQNFSRDDGSYDPGDYSSNPNNKIMIQLLSFQNLDADGIFGDIDPYVIATLGSTSVRSSTASGQDPNWNSYPMKFTNFDPLSQITFDVYDEDTGNIDGYIGSGSLYVSDCLPDGCSNQAIQLSRDGNQNSGTIYVDVNTNIYDGVLHFLSGNNFPSSSGTYYLEYQRPGYATLETSHLTGANPFWNKVSCYSNLDDDTNFAIQAWEDITLQPDEQIGSNLSYNLGLCNSTRCYESYYIPDADPTYITMGVFKGTQSTIFGKPSDPISFNDWKLFVFDMQIPEGVRIINFYTYSQFLRFYLWSQGDSVTSVCDTPYFTKYGNGSYIWEDPPAGSTIFSLSASEATTPILVYLQKYSNFEGKSQGTLASNAVEFYDVDVDPTSAYADGMFIYASTTSLEAGKTGDPDLFIWDYNNNEWSAFSITSLVDEELLIAGYNCINAPSVCDWIWSWDTQIPGIYQMSIAVFAYQTSVQYSLSLGPYWNLIPGKETTLTSVLNSLILLEMMIPDGSDILGLQITADQTLPENFVASVYLCSKIVNSMDSHIFPSPTNFLYSFNFSDVNASGFLTFSNFGDAYAAIYFSEPYDGTFTATFNSWAQITSYEPIQRETNNDNEIQYFYYKVVSRDDTTNSQVIINLQKNTTDSNDTATYIIYASLSTWYPGPSSYDQMQTGNMEGTSMSFSAPYGTTVFFSIYRTTGRPYSVYQINVAEFFLPQYKGWTYFTSFLNTERFVMTTPPFLTNGMVLKIENMTETLTVFLALNDSLIIEYTDWVSTSSENSDFVITAESLSSRGVTVDDTLYFNIIPSSQDNPYFKFVDLIKPTISIYSDIDDEKIRSGNAWINFTLSEGDIVFQETISFEPIISNMFIDSFSSDLSISTGWIDIVAPSLKTDFNTTLNISIDLRSVLIRIPALSEYYITEDETLTINFDDQCFFPIIGFSSVQLVIPTSVVPTPTPTPLHISSESSNVGLISGIVVSSVVLIVAVVGISFYLIKKKKKNNNNDNSEIDSYLMEDFK
ncbi:conserved serine proline-rich protein [Anaeramoeba ignava]|uniref:Conserved serine proline-rich protein n=1 Tax=Anaeramoeba ignava TaxID=1746090 RepID=A0A9Q0LHE6_ANAIG|nr:conserved serine proline-rich protein [Anaeramoeba ignava]